MTHASSITHSTKPSFLLCKTCDSCTMALFDQRCLSCARLYVTNLEVKELSELFTRTTKVTRIDDGA